MPYDSSTPSLRSEIGSIRPGSLSLPGVTYFQVIFTLPEELSALALGNRKEMYDLLFQVAWRCLSRKIEKELGIRSAGQAVLHTWNQRLGHHPHVHLAVPGNGPSLDGTRLS
ncbi:transposase [Pirellulaceae bacterium SH449]